VNMRRYPQLYHSLYSNPSAWDKFADANTGAFSRVKTLIAAAPEQQVPRFLQSLCTLCGDIETLVIKDLTAATMQELRSLNEVRPRTVTVDRTPMSEIFAPRIEHVVLETYPHCAPTFGHLLDLKPKFHQASTEFAAFRAAGPGTAEMKSFTVRLVDALELPERVEFELERGAVLRLEVTKKNICAGRQSLMNTNTLGDSET